MGEIDRQYLETPFYGSRRMKAWLERRGKQVSRKRVQRLMRIMGLRAIYRKPKTSRPASERRVYPYLLRNTRLRNARITRANQVWAADITYPLAGQNRGGIKGESRRRIDYNTGSLDPFLERVSEEHLGRCPVAPTPVKPGYQRVRQLGAPSRLLGLRFGVEDLRLATRASFKASRRSRPPRCWTGPPHTGRQVISRGGNPRAMGK